MVLEPIEATLQGRKLWKPRYPSAAVWCFPPGAQ